MPSILLTPGRRKSASTSSTRLPFCAKTIAAFALIVVFPSSGSALVTRRTFGGVPQEDNKMEVRNARYDSAAADLGLEKVTSRVDGSAPSPSAALVRARRLLSGPIICRGMVPSAGSVE